MPSYDHPGFVHPRLGRLPAADPGDANYPMHLALNQLGTPTTLDGHRHWWGYRYHLDQGSSPECVAYSAFHLLVDSPTPRRLDNGALRLYTPDGSIYQLTPQSLYDRCQMVDEYADTPPAGGTSVRAAQKILQQVRLTASYWWAQDIEDVVRAVLHEAPVHIGVAFYEQMFSPEGADAMIRIGGAVAGGHAMKVDGVHAVSASGAVSLDETIFRVKNSWGPAWGRDGWCHITARDLERLLFAEDGEAAIPTELPA